MSQCFSLSRTVLVNVLSEWIHFKSLVKFDVAVCNKTDRIFLVNLYETKSFSITDFGVKPQCAILHYEKFFGWISKREIKLEELIFDGKNMPELKHFLEILNTSKVTTLQLKNYAKALVQSTDFREMFSACPSLTTLKLCTIADGITIFIAMSPQTLRQLTCLKANGTFFDMDQSALSYLADNCTNLRTLEARINCKQNKHEQEKELFQLIQNNKNLQQLVLNHINCSAEFVDVICANLHVLKFRLSLQIYQSLQWYESFKPFQIYWNRI